MDEHIEKVIDDVGRMRAEHDLERAQKRGANAEDDAAFAVEFASAAIEEAEYAVLNATLVRAEADKMTETKAGTTG